LTLELALAVIAVRSRNVLYLAKSCRYLQWGMTQSSQVCQDQVVLPMVTTIMGLVALLVVENHDVIE
jgi:hypothetical protein